MHSAWSHTGAYQQLTAVYQSGRITADIYHYLSAYFVKIYVETHEIVFQHSKYAKSVTDNITQICSSSLSDPCRWSDLETAFLLAYNLRRGWHITSAESWTT